LVFRVRRRPKIWPRGSGQAHQARVGLRLPPPYWRLSQRLQVAHRAGEKKMAKFGSTRTPGLFGAGVRLPRSGSALLSVRDADKPGAVDVAQRLARLGFRLLATRGTGEFVRRAGVPVNTVAKVQEGSPHVVDL
jgi:MGS-like domain